jgi:hypothetical protein
MTDRMLECIAKAEALLPNRTPEGTDFVPILQTADNIECDYPKRSVPFRKRLTARSKVVKLLAIRPGIHQNNDETGIRLWIGRHKARSMMRPDAKKIGETSLVVESCGSWCWGLGSR